MDATPTKTSTNSHRHIMREHDETHGHANEPRTTEVSDRASSASEDSAQSPPLKKRKNTYYVRKESIRELHKLVAMLQQELSQAREISKAMPILVQTQYQAQIHRNHQLFAGLASMLASYKQAPCPLLATPLASCIHLPLQQQQRDDVLRSLHTDKVNAAFQFMVERTRFLDPQLKCYHEELIHVPSGDAVSICLNITRFERRYSLRQVFEALKCFVVNQQEIFSEATDTHHRKSYSQTSDEDFLCGQVRLSSRISEGAVEVESNSVTFLSFVEASTTDDTASHAVAVSDFVDHDEMDSRPNETSIREKMTSAVLIKETTMPCGAIVTLSKWTHSRFCAPKTQPLTRLQVEELHAVSKRRWDTMLRVLHERLEALW